MLIDMRGLRPLKPQVVAMEVRNLVSSLIVDLRGYPAKSSLSCKHLWQRTY